MKKILLASVALSAFAGAAAAEVSFSGSASLGYNDTTGGDNDGFYWAGTVNTTFAAELDNGLTAGATVNFEVEDNGAANTASANTGIALDSDDFVVFVKSGDAAVYFGDTTAAAAKYWTAAGDMESDGFTTDAFDAAEVDAVLRGDMSYGSVSLSVSTLVVADEAEQLSFSAKAALGAVTLSAAYEEATTTITEGGDANDDEIFGLAAGFSAAGADIVVAYAEDENSDSTGLKVTYPMGDVKVTAYYVSESVGDDNYGINVAYSAGAASVTLDYQDDQGTTKVALDGSYDLGNGLTVLAGVYDEENAGTDSYIAASYDLGGGAALLVSYADAEVAGNIADDEIGANDYQVGTTVELSFAF